MKTERYVAAEFNTNQLVSTILDQHHNTALASQAIGILLCDSTLDCAQIEKELHDALNIPIIGGTVMSFLSEGISAVFTILHGDDVFFSTALSEPIDNKNYKAPIKNLYNQCLTALDASAKLIIPFIPYDRKHNIDTYAGEIFELAGDIPVFGGIHAHDMIGGIPGIFCNDRYACDRVALLMIGGNIKPLFAYEADATPVSEYAPLVTLARGNKLYEVDGIPFCRYAKEHGIQISPSGTLYHEYGPLRFTEPDAPAALSYFRAITSVAEDGSYVALTSRVPLPSRVSMTVMKKKNIANSATKCVEDIKQKIAENEKDGYKYSSMFCVSCVSRYLIYIGSKNFETELITKEFPNAVSYYAFGEIGPVDIDNKLKNRFHNASLIICAI